MDPLTIMSLLSTGLGLASTGVNAFKSIGAANKQAEDMKKLGARNNLLSQFQNTQAGNTVRSNFPVNGTHAPLFAQFGLSNPMQGAMPVEAEGGEHVANPMQEGDTLTGNSHEQGGEVIGLNPGETVFSDDPKMVIGKEVAKFLKGLGIPVKPTDTFATAAEKVSKKQEGLGDTPKHGREGNTNRLMNERYAAAKEVLAMAQQEKAPAAQAQQGGTPEMPMQEGGLPQANFGMTNSLLGLGAANIFKNNFINHPYKATEQPGGKTPFDWNKAGGIASQAAPFVSGLADFFVQRHAINKMEAPPVPSTMPLTRMNKSLDVGTQLGALKENRALAHKVAGNFSGQQQKQGAQVFGNREYAKGINEIMQAKTQYANQMENHERAIQSQEMGNNLNLLNAHKQGLTDFRNNRTAALANNTSNLFANFQQGGRDMRMEVLDKEKFAWIQSSFDQNVQDAVQAQIDKLLKKDKTT